MKSREVVTVVNGEQTKNLSQSPQFDFDSATLSFQPSADAP
jgi:hypothetical protein